MRDLLDTSVLVAAFHTSHRYHQPSFELLRPLTGMLALHPADPDHVMLFIKDLRDRLSLVALDERAYFQTLEASGAGGLTSGAIYDSLLGHCALKAGAGTIYTWNTKDFLRLPPSIASRVKTPDQI